MKSFFTKKQQLKGISIMEVLFSLSLVAIIIVISLYGVTILRRASRDEKRVTTVGELAEIINDYYKDNFKYPTTNSVVFTTTDLTIGSQSVYTFTEHTRYNPTQTSSSGTRYYYESSSGGFALCVQLENGSIKEVGTKSCPSVTLW